jgi:flagellar motor protein MotB
MTIAMVRWFSPLLVCLVLAGCNMPMPDPSTTEEAEFFAQGMDQYIKSGELATLKVLPQLYPHGEWRARAETIINASEMINDAEEQQRQLQNQQKKLQNQQKKLQDQQEKVNKELAQCRQGKEFLFQDRKILEVTLERLKQVLIDMELRAK